MAGDWWQNSTLPLLEGYVATGVVPVSDSGTVNGAGRYNGGPAVPWSVVNVVKGKRYRLRIINESARNVFTMSVDGHPLSRLPLISGLGLILTHRFPSPHRGRWCRAHPTYR